MTGDNSYYVIEQEQLDKLSAIAARLQGGTDRERDEGHKLWLIVNEVRNAFGLQHHLIRMGRQ